MNILKKIFAGIAAGIFAYFAFMALFLAQIPNPDSPISEWPRYGVLMSMSALYGGIAFLMGVIATNK